MRDFGKLPKAEQKRIGAVIDKLARTPRPRGCRKLDGPDEGYYRIRIGAYRVVYDVGDAGLRVLVIRIRHRSDVYR